MGEIEKKRFKEPSFYFWYSIFLVIVLIGGTLGNIYFGLFLSELDLHEMYADREISGYSRIRVAQTLERFFLIKFGKQGFMFLGIACNLVFIFHFWEIIAEYRRYKKKCRLFHEGLIENFYDIYDDHVPLLSWHRIKMLFSRKEKPLKKKLPNKRTMKKHIKQSEKYFKQKK